MDGYKAFQRDELSELSYLLQHPTETTRSIATRWNGMTDAEKAKLDDAEQYINNMRISRSILDSLRRDEVPDFYTSFLDDEPFRLLDVVMGRYEAACLKASGDR